MFFFLCQLATTAQEVHVNRIKQDGLKKAVKKLSMKPDRKLDLVQRRQNWLDMRIQEVFEGFLSELK